MSKRIPIMLAILGCYATLATAQDLNIKPGLWELTVTREVKGDPLSGMPAKEKAELEAAKARMSAEVEAAKARMSPEQRAQMEAAVKEQAGIMAAMMKPTITRACFTKESIRTSLAKFAAGTSSGTDNSGCKITPVRSTATVMESREVCSSNGNNSIATLLFEAPNPETLTFKGEGSAVGGGTLEMKIKATGKWLGPACGDVKP
jgi:hypothetical protein